MGLPQLRWAVPTEARRTEDVLHQLVDELNYRAMAAEMALMNRGLLECLRAAIAANML